MGSEAPTLAEDEATLRSIAAELLAGIDASLDRWIERGLNERSAGQRGGLDAEVIGDVVAKTRAIVMGDVERVLTADVDAGAGNPLAVLRDGVGPMTDALQAAGCEPATRDPFHQQAFPNDPYGLGPASFADVDEQLHELGLRWGAARAHIHLRRRREQTSPEARTDG